MCQVEKVRKLRECYNLMMWYGYKRFDFFGVCKRERPSWMEWRKCSWAYPSWLVLFVTRKRKNKQQKKRKKEREIQT